MPWRNQGRQAHVSWRLGSNPAGICHYGDPWRDFYVRSVRRGAVRSVLRGVRVDRLLDVGCGDGSWLPFLGGLVRARVRHACDVATFGQPPAGFFLADIETLPLANHSYDLATAITVLAHTENQSLALDELTRIASGYVLILDFLMDPTPAWAHGLPHRRVFTRSGLDAEMRSRDFGAVKVAGCGVFDGFFRFAPRWGWPVLLLPSLLADMVSASVSARSRYQAVLYARGSSRGKASKDDAR